MRHGQPGVHHRLLVVVRVEHDCLPEFGEGAGDGPATEGQVDVLVGDTVLDIRDFRVPERGCRGERAAVEQVAAVVQDVHVDEDNPHLFAVLDAETLEINHLRFADAAVDNARQLDSGLTRRPGLELLRSETRQFGGGGHAAAPRGIGVGRADQ